LKQFQDAGFLSGQPKRTWQTEVDSGGFNRDRRGTVFHQRGHLLGGAEVSLVDDAGFAVDAGAFDDVVVELVGLLLGDKGRHIG
jgi:hypothetical protein